MERTVKMSGKSILAIGIVSLAAALFASEQKTQTTAAPKVAKITERKTLSPMMQANEADFRRLKTGLGVDSPDLSRTDALELVALAYGKLLDGMNARVSALESQTADMKAELSRLREENAELKKRTDAIDADVTKLFNWSDKVDVEIHNEQHVGGIAYKLRRFRLDVEEDVDALSTSVKDANYAIDILKTSVKQNAANINELAAAFNSLR